MHDPKALPQTPLNTLRRPGRPDPADAEQLRHAPVSLRRIAALFAPFRWQMGVVVALIIASSVDLAGEPVPIRGSSTRRSRTGRRPAALDRRPDAAHHDRRRGARRAADVDLHDGRPARHARPAHARLRAPAAPVARLLHAHARGRGAVAPDQRHRRHAVGRDLDGDVDRVQHDRRGRHRGRDGRAELAARRCSRCS